MPEPLHHTTLAAIERLAQTHSLPIVRADDDVVILGDEFRAEKCPWKAPAHLAGKWMAFRSAPGGVTCRMRAYKTPLHALRAALREVQNG